MEGQDEHGWGRAQNEDWGSEVGQLRPSPGEGLAPHSRRTGSADLLPQIFSGHPDLRFCADREGGPGVLLLNLNLS